MNCAINIRLSPTDLHFSLTYVSTGKQQSGLTYMHCKPDFLLLLSGCSICPPPPFSARAYLVLH